jgi:hypothetical protein
VNVFCLFWINAYGFLEDIPYIFLDIPFEKMLPKIEIAYIAVMLSSRFSHKSVDIFVYIYFLNYNSCYGKGKTNNLTKENYWKNIYQNIKIAFQEFCVHLNNLLHVKFSVKMFGFYCFCICCYYVLNKNRVKQILLV